MGRSVYSPCYILVCGELRWEMVPFVSVCHLRLWKIWVQPQFYHFLIGFGTSTRVAPGFCLLICQVGMIVMPVLTMEQVICRLLTGHLTGYAFVNVPWDTGMLLMTQLWLSPRMDLLF